MKKKILAIALCAAMALGLCACGAMTEEKSIKKSQKTIQYDPNTGEELYTMEYEYDEKGREVYFKQTYNPEEDMYYGQDMEYEIEWEDDGDTAVGTYIYDEDESEQRQEIEYDKDGHAVEIKIYYDDVLSSKTQKEYEKGKLVESKQTIYSNGEPYQTTKNEFNEYEHVVKSVITRNNEVLYKCEYEYEYDNDGNILKQTMIAEQNGEKTEQEIEVEYDKDGHMKSAEYDDGTYIEYECDDDGNIIEMKQYSASGILVYEMSCEYYED